MHVNRSSTYITYTHLDPKNAHIRFDLYQNKRKLEVFS
jgi:hypothetical protein